jgi:hypothetical protein
VLSFAPPGQPLDISLVPGTTMDADLAFYPGAAPLRALVVARRPGGDGADRAGVGVEEVPSPFPGQGAGNGDRPGVGFAGVPPGLTPEEAMDEVAAALAADPWTESWPLVLAGVVPEESSLGGFPLRRFSRRYWRLVAVSGGHPVTVAAEWTPQGLDPLTTWDDEGMAVVL